MRVAYHCLPILPGRAEVIERIVGLARRGPREWGEADYHLEVAHLEMVQRDRAFVEVVACCEAGYMDLAEEALRGWWQRADAVGDSVGVARDLVRARRVEGRLRGTGPVAGRAAYGSPGEGDAT
jgi:hypothetical protein